MKNISYRLTGENLTPAVVTVGENTTPVWIQSEWPDGEYQEFVQRNGCGHSCCAMVLNLNGIKINPHEEFALCREKWGEPGKGQGNWASVAGIVKILDSFGVKADYFGVPKGGCCAAAEQIVKHLKEGKQVIVWSQPSDRLKPNPFSTGDHYVLLVSVDDDGQILVANSSRKGTTDDGIQFATVDVIAAVLCDGCEPGDCTWGTTDLPHSSGYVVVG